MARLSWILALAVFSLCLLVDAADPVSVTYPPVTGPHDVGTTSLKLTDYARQNPFTGHGHREFIVQLFYPAQNATQYPLAQYMEPKTAAYHEIILGLPPGTIPLIKLNSHENAPIESSSEIRVILFSPAYGATRHAYTSLLENLASYGYVVVAFDHTNDAAVVEFPSGTLVFRDPAVDPNDPAMLLKLLDVRVGDIHFALDLLYSNLTLSIPGVGTRLSVTETGMYGNGLGGATAVAAMFTDCRILGGIDIDGSVYGPVVKYGLWKPLLLMGVPSNNLDTDSTWIALWAHLRGWKRALVLAGSENLTYSDFPVAAELMGNISSVFTPVELVQMLGTIGGLRANEVQRVYILAFFDFLLRGDGSGLFDGPDPRYPEFSFQS